MRRIVAAREASPLRQCFDAVAEALKPRTLSLARIASRRPPEVDDEQRERSWRPLLLCESDGLDGRLDPRPTTPSDESKQRPRGNAGRVTAAPLTSGPLRCGRARARSGRAARARSKVARRAALAGQSRTHPSCFARGTRISTTSAPSPAPRGNQDGPRDDEACLPSARNAAAHGSPSAPAARCDVPGGWLIGAHARR
jgi:hypothetical protein